MDDGKSLNSKIVTRVTIRITKPDRADSLNSLFRKTSLTQNAFFNELIWKGYLSMANDYADVAEPTKKFDSTISIDEFIRKLDELKTLILDSHETQMNEIKSSELKNDVILKLSSSSYNILLLLMSDKKIPEQLIRDRIIDIPPERFRGMLHKTK